MKITGKLKATVGTIAKSKSGLGKVTLQEEITVMLSTPGEAVVDRLQSVLLS